MILYHLGKFHDQTINLSEDISKESFRKNVISQDLLFVSISLLIRLWRRKGMENRWNEKCLQIEIKTSSLTL